MSTELLDRLPATALLAAASLGLSLLLGLAVALCTAPRQGGAVDQAVFLGSILILSMPVFWLGMLLLYAFGFHLRWLPLGGVGGPAHLVLPALTLGLPGAAYYGRLLHVSLHEELLAPYVRTARAKGVSANRVLWHALRCSLGPLVTVVGLDLAALLGGVVVTETVFGWPGIGRLTVDAVFNQDVPLVMGATLLGSTLTVLANLAVDGIQSALDPRVDAL